jgi:YebC/PmpR family DNA-binding regulatory protein
MVKCLTDNKNRTATSVRTAFNKNGGNLGETGCVSYMFERKGYIVIDGNGIEEDDLFLEAIDAGAEELEASGEAFEIYTAPENLNNVKTALEEKGYKLETAEITWIPQTYTQLDETTAEKMYKLIDVLEDDDDVQEVFHNMQEDE